MGLWGTLVGIVMVLCAVWVIYDVWAKHKGMKKEHKIIWTVCAVILNIVAAVVYYFMVKKK